jgi:uncharacterized membrane protein
MSKSRLEAFTDGVIAIIITIMVLELKTPNGGDWASLQPVLPVMILYILSFVLVAIYWNNHHHMLHATTHVSGAVLWANNHLLFWLSLVPFVTRWMGENHRIPVPTAAYGIVMLMAAVAYTLLQRQLLAREGPHSRLAKAVGTDFKGYLSLTLYTTAIPLAFVNTWISDALYLAVALIWLVPDPRIERQGEAIS